jgi:hypothetical protein
VTVDAKPGTGLPPQLVETWTHGKMSHLIQWGVPGDFERCITAIQGEVTKDGKAPLSDHVIKGLCATLHRIATGASPGHAVGEQSHHG